jgi:glycosyltransferase involved in cell wall biosynthesis
MAASRPVILAIDGVIRDVVEQASAGIFVQPGSHQEMAAAIQKLSQDRQLCIKMGQSGREYVEKNFNRSRLADQLSTMLDQMIIN